MSVYGLVVTMKKIEIEWLCGSRHLHHNYPFMADDADAEEFSEEWLGNVVCKCGAAPESYIVFEKGLIEMPRWKQ